MNRNSLIIAVAALVGILLYSSVYVVQEFQQAIKTRLGEVVGEPVTEPGLHFKMPFVEEVRFLDKRILTWDGTEEQVPTRDKKIIFVDTTARWRIVDPIKFLQTVHSEFQAKVRIGSIIDGETKSVVSKYDLVETVRSTNRILEQRKAQDQKRNEDEQEKITGEIVEISVGREKLSELIVENSRREINDMGIELIDVLIRRIAYQKDVEQKVYDRMISERTRIAEKIRSIGKGEAAKIKGTMNLDLKEIQSDAARRSKEITGKADAEAIKIFADALNQDPEFYQFIRSLEVYKSIFQKKGALVLSTNSELFKGLESAKNIGQ